MPLDRNDITAYVESHIGDFHQRRLKSLESLKLGRILKRKNPYLFRAKNVLSANELVASVLSAHISSQEETIFGDFIEGLAIFVCQQSIGGRKSSTLGIDLEFDKEGVRYLIVIKSGPNWGNSRQVVKMRDDFRQARRVYGTSGNRTQVECVNGCCYGQEPTANKGDYIKICGQAFWTFISGDENLFVEIIEPLGHQAKERNEAFTVEYTRLLNLFTHQFLDEFCTNGLIDWERLVRFNSGVLPARRVATSR